MVGYGDYGFLCRSILHFSLKLRILGIFVWRNTGYTVAFGRWNNWDVPRNKKKKWAGIIPLIGDCFGEACRKQKLQVLFRGLTGVFYFDSKKKRCVFWEGALGDALHDGSEIITFA